MKIKLGDLKVKQVVKICNNHMACRFCPLFNYDTEQCYYDKNVPKFCNLDKEVEISEVSKRGGK